MWVCRMRAVFYVANSSLVSRAVGRLIGWLVDRSLGQLTK